MDKTILNGIKEIEKSLGKIQEFRDADEEMAHLLQIKVGDPVNYRVVVIQRDEPLIHAVSLIPVDRLDNDFREDLIRADIPIGRILKKHQIESRREIKSVTVEESSPEMVEIFNDAAPVLSRTYNIIHNDQVLIWIKETFPSSLFVE